MHLLVTEELEIVKLTTTLVSMAKGREVLGKGTGRL